MSPICKKEAGDSFIVKVFLSLDQPHSNSEQVFRGSSKALSLNTLNRVDAYSSALFTFTALLLVVENSAKAMCIQQSQSISEKQTMYDYKRTDMTF